MRRLSLVGVFVQAALVTATDWSTININSNAVSEVIERDVCVLGGGSSGVHAAVSLLELNKTVVVVERNNYLGGHAHTFLEPQTGIPVDIGVVIFQNQSAVLDFFEKFDVPLINENSIVSNEIGQMANLSLPAYSYNTSSIHADFRSGLPVTPYAPDGAGTALQSYAEELAKFPYLLEGYELPFPVPEDLYMPFGAFLEKYNLTDALPIISRISQGMGDLLSISTIYAAKYFNLHDVASLDSGYLVQAQGNTSLLFTRAGSYVGAENILLRSSIVSTNRQNITRPEILVSTVEGELKLLSCAQILSTIPPSLTNLAGWDLTPAEHAVFSQYTRANGYYTGLVRGVGLNQSVITVNAANRSSMPFGLPVLPALYDFGPVGVLDDVWNVKFGADVPTMDESQVKAYVEREIATLQAAANVTPTCDIEWLVFDSHTPFFLQVSPEAIRDGFFRDLTALQGGLEGKMFYSGAAFHTHHSTLLWQFNKDVVIPKMLE